jgi:hypothetical protein
MKQLEDRTMDNRLLRFEAELAARLESLFLRWLPLHGFSVQESGKLGRKRCAGHLEGDLFLADLACYPALDGEQAAALCEEISAELLDLVEDRPEAAELLRGRTFARTVH